MKTRNLLIVAVAAGVLIAAGILMFHPAPSATVAETAADHSTAAAQAATPALAESASTPVKPVLPETLASAPPAPQSQSVAPVVPKIKPAGTLTGPEEILLDSAITLDRRETAPDVDGRFLRTRLVRADFKYPLLRVEETFRRDPATGAETLVHRQEMVADHIMVMLREDASEQDLQALLALHGGEIRRKMHTPNLYLVELPNPGLDAVRQAVELFAAETAVVKHAGVDYVVHALQTFPNDPNFANLWGLHNTGQTISGQAGVADADIDAPEAWDIFAGSRDIVVGVIDTGIDYNHQDLAANMWTNPGEIAGNGIDDDGNGYVDDIYGWNFLNETANPYDDNMHGTHCAGTIGGTGNNGIGVAGVNWRVKMAALKFLSAAGSGAISDAVEAVNYATRMRFRLTSNSWGGGGYDPVMNAALNTADQSNSLFVCAAGNSGSNNDTYEYYPANYTSANVIAVAATDNRDQLASFSSYGLTKVDLGAPGVQIYSCKQNNTYQYLNGTSMATPHVAGAAALAWGYKPDATFIEIKNFILDNTDPIPALSGKCVSGGRLNIYNMLEKIDPSILITPAEIMFSGADGGPFAPLSSAYIVRNVGSNTFFWTAAESADWLDLSLTAGTLAPGESNVITISWNSAALARSPGIHTAGVTFSNSVSGRTSLREVTLEVLDSLSVSPLSGLTATGPDGGPFSPSSVVYVLSNRASSARTWTGRVTADWIQLSATNGTLAVGAAQNVTLSINANANALRVATNTASATFSNHTSAVVHVRPVTNVVYESLSITPAAGLVASGENGGPFAPDSFVYAISNRANSARSWVSTWSGNWFQTTPASATLAAGATGTVTVTLTSNVNALADGIHSGTVTFSNTSSSVLQDRPVTARVAVDDFTEEYWYNDCDLDYKQLIFHPTNSLKGYMLHRAAVTTFPVSTNGHTPVSLTDDGYLYCGLSAGKKVKLYGTQYSGFYIGANGYITFTRGDTENDFELDIHFAIPRISMFLRDLAPDLSGKVSWAQLSDRAVVTFVDVPYWGGTNNLQSFQTEMFFDGTIRITYLRLDVVNTIIGLSRGGGIPAAFINSDLSRYPLCPDVLSAEITSPLEGQDEYMPRVLPQYKDNLITADAGAPAGTTLTGVDVMANGSLIGTDTTAPYSIIWTNSPPGSYALTAVARNSLGNSFTSSPVNVTVKLPDLWWWGYLWEDWNMEPEHNDRPGENWVGDAYHWMDGSIAEFRTWSMLERTNVTIQAAGVAPYAVVITNSTIKTFTFRGGDVTDGFIFKAGAGLAVFNNYTGSLSFPSGTIVQGGTLRFVSLADKGGARTQQFGAGPVWLNGGTFSFAGGALSNGQINTLANPFIVETSSTLTHGRYGTYSPKIVFGGDILFSNNAALAINTFGSSYSGVDSNGVELAGTIILNGTGRLQRLGHHNTYLTLSGNITDGSQQAGRLMISNAYNSTTAGRYMKIRGAANTYSGGTVIGNDNLIADFTTFAGAVEVGADSRLGTGDVTVEGGGLLRLTGANNIHSNATLELKTGGGLIGTVWIASGVTNVLTTLILGTDDYTQGVFTSNNAPGFIAGPGAIRLADDTPRILLSATEVSVPEGGTNVFGVKWSLPLPGSVTVQVDRVSGDTDITVSPGSLVFGPGDWDAYRYVTLSAAADGDWIADTSVIRCSAPGSTGADVLAVEVEKDTDPAYLLPWTETFENDGTNAGTLGPLNGQRGWIASGAAVTNRQAQGGAQSAQLANGMMSHSFSNGAGEVWITLWAQMAAGATNSAIPATASAVFYVNTNGTLSVYDGAAPVNLSLAVSNGWNRFDVYCDYTLKIWRLSVNGTPAGTDFGFYSAARSSFAVLSLVNESGSDAWVDTLAIGLTDPSLPEDSDGDGLPDDWEEEHFGNLNANPGDLAANGINTVEECYIAGLNPTLSSALFQMTSLNPLPAANILKWQGVSGRVYSVYWSSNLLSGFHILQSNVSWIGNVFTDAVHGAANEGFYRIGVQLE